MIGIPIEVFFFFGERYMKLTQLISLNQQLILWYMRDGRLLPLVINQVQYWSDFWKSTSKFDLEFIESNEGLS